MDYVERKQGSEEVVTVESNVIGMTSAQNSPKPPAPVTVADLVAAVSAAGGPKVDKRRVEIANPIKTLGSHTATIRLHPEVSANLGVPVGVVNVMGRVFMTPIDDPFAVVLREVEALSSKARVIIVDDDSEGAAALPNDYGVNQFPLIVQSVPVNSSGVIQSTTAGLTSSATTFPASSRRNVSVTMPS